MSRDKQISEMAKAVCHLDRTCDECMTSFECKAMMYAKRFYNAGYRKSTDVAEEIFAEIEEKFDKMIDEATNELSSARLEYDFKAVKFLLYHIDVIRMARITIGTLQNKYIGKDTNVTTNTEGEKENG